GARSARPSSGAEAASPRAGRCLDQNGRGGKGGARSLNSFPQAAPPHTGRAMKVIRAGLWPILALARRAENPLPASLAVIAASSYLVSPSWERSRQYRSEEHTSELQSRRDLVCRLL